MKYLFLTLMSVCWINIPFAQESDFFQKLNFLDLVFYQKEVGFSIQISGNTQENYEGTFKISSNTYEIENCSLKTTSHKKDITQIKSLLNFGVLSSNTMYRALYSYKAHHIGKYNASYISENTWKLTCADETTREKLQLEKNDNCYFIITLNNEGHITQIKSVIEGKREDVVHYATEKLSAEDAQALGGEIAKILVGNSLIAYFREIEGKVLNPQTGNTLHFILKTKQ